MTSALFSPIKLADVELANRLVISPMCQYSGNDGCANDWHHTHLGMLANSGAGMVIFEATHVERIGRITHGCLGLYSDANEAALARVVAHCRYIGKAKLGIQLAHAGRKASSQRPWEGGLGLKVNGGDEPWETIGPSAIAAGDAWAAPREMTEADITRVREAFVSAAKRAVRLGFDLIELHGAHGYLGHSFFSPISNKRTDRYGGSLENRMRFLVETAEAMRAVVPRSVVLGARITGDDWMEGGITPDDAVKLAAALKAKGLDYVDVSSGGITAQTRNPVAAGYNVPMATKIKREVGIPVMAVGLITTPDQAESIVKNGEADLVAIGRGFLDNPHWGYAAARALGAEVERPPQYLRVAPKLWATPASAAKA